MLYDENIYILLLLKYYQKYFRGVDICDQLRSKYPIGRNSKKWWKYLMNFLINLCIINGYILYTENSQLHVKYSFCRHLGWEGGKLKCTGELRMTIFII
jgi:hypothetical protein